MKQMALDMGLSAGPTLGSFIAGPNREALEHLQLWIGGNARGVMRSPVPTYLWGPQGSGKSHLLRATQHALESQGLVVGWLDGQSVLGQAYQEDWAAVLIDDAHKLSAAGQQQAFNWFINAQTLQRCVVAAGALPPADLPLREDLRTRLGWGHVFGLAVLSEAERRAVLRQSADARGIFLSDEVMNYILSHFARDLSSLSALLERLDGYSLQKQRPITVALIRSMLETD